MIKLSNEIINSQKWEAKHPKLTNIYFFTIQFLEKKVYIFGYFYWEGLPQTQAQVVWFQADL